MGARHVSWHIMYISPKLLLFYAILALIKAYCIYNSSSKYFVWLPSPLLMACRLLVRDTMVFIRNFICPNYLQNIILQKNLLLLIFRPCNFYPVLSKLLQWFRSTGLLRVFIKNCQVTNFFAKRLTKNLLASSPGQAKNTIKISGTCQQKFVQWQAPFYFWAK